MIEVIAFSGYAQSGKDTAAKFLTDRGYTRLAFADTLREMALALDPYVNFERKYYEGSNEWVDEDAFIRLSELIEAEGWDIAKESYPDVRRLLQRLGTEAGRQILGEDIWVDTTFKKITGPTVITDCRFVNEARKVREHGGLVIRINRPGIGPKNDHVSEIGLDDYNFDYVLNNNGTVEDLYAQLERFRFWQ